nr:hypothetical protein [Tanacetum cinerariifolium]
METCEEPILMELYVVVCKAEDDLGVHPHEKYMNKANDEEIDERVTQRTEWFFYEPVTKKRKAFPKCYYFRNLGRKARLVAVMIVVQHQALKEMQKIHRMTEVFT